MSGCVWYVTVNANSVVYYFHFLQPKFERSWSATTRLVVGVFVVLRFLLWCLGWVSENGLKVWYFGPFSSHIFMFNFLLFRISLLFWLSWWHPGFYIQCFFLVFCFACTPAFASISVFSFFAISRWPRIHLISALILLHVCKMLNIKLVASTKKTYDISCHF